LRPSLTAGLPLSCHQEARRDYFEIANKQTGAVPRGVETFSTRDNPLLINEIEPLRRA
jgi:phosphoribosylaminoimidazole carboxylase (NCAIR synthetase)